MPGQKIPVSEKHSLEFLSKMEPRNISPDVVYVKRRGDSNSDASDSIIRDMTTSQSGLENSNEDVPVKIKTIQWITVIILCFVNLINYMDRYTIAGKPFIDLTLAYYLSQFNP